MLVIRIESLISKENSNWSIKYCSSFIIPAAYIHRLCKNSFCRYPALNIGGHGSVRTVNRWLNEQHLHKATHKTAANVITFISRDMSIASCCLKSLTMRALRSLVLSSIKVIHSRALNIGGHGSVRTVNRWLNEQHLHKATHKTAANVITSSAGSMELVMWPSPLEHS
jgi:hypothetical protein